MSASRSGKVRAVETLEADDGYPFKVTNTKIECPFGDGEMLDISIGWVDRNFPVLHIDAPEVIGHLNRLHKGTL